MEPGGGYLCEGEILPRMSGGRAIESGRGAGAKGAVSIDFEKG